MQQARQRDPRHAGRQRPTPAGPERPTTSGAPAPAGTDPALAHATYSGGWGGSGPAVREALPSRAPVWRPAWTG